MGSRTRMEQPLMMVTAQCDKERGMEVLTLVLARDPDHYAQVSAGRDPGTILRITMLPRQAIDLSDLLGRKTDLPDHRPN